MTDGFQISSSVLCQPTCFILNRPIFKKRKCIIFEICNKSYEIVTSIFEISMKIFEISPKSVRFGTNTL